MSQSSTTINEVYAEKAFSKQSVVFDEIYNTDRIIQYKRERVRAHVLKHLPKKASILELNAGTGEDAIYFAQRGHTVHATDISTGMLAILEKKVADKQLGSNITKEQCSFTALEGLINQGPYDQIFSNFAGLNCTDKLDKVLQSLSPLLKPGGVVTLVILPTFCLWEFLLLFKGKWKTAFRRFAGKKGARSHIEGEYFTCWYYNPSYVIQNMGKEFELSGIEGLCTLVPPSYINGFAGKYPAIFRFLCRQEGRWKSYWPWRLIGDYYIISLRKK